MLSFKHTVKRMKSTKSFHQSKEFMARGQTCDIISCANKERTKNILVRDSPSWEGQ